MIASFILLLFIENVRTFKYHDFCYTSYTSKDKINRSLKRIDEELVVGPSAKCLNQSSVSMFDFKRNCFICGEYCETTSDAKNPGCWEKDRDILCRKADPGKTTKALKKFYWRFIMFLIPDTLPLQFKKIKTSFIG